MSVRKNDEERTSQYSLSVFCISSSVIKESDICNTEHYFSKNVCAETKFALVKSSAVVSCLTGQAKIWLMSLEVLAQRSLRRVQQTVL